MNIEDCKVGDKIIILKRSYGKTYGYYIREIGKVLKTIINTKEGSSFSKDDLRDVFIYTEEKLSEIREELKKEVIKSNLIYFYHNCKSDLEIKAMEEAFEIFKKGRCELK